ncbi:cysteine--tRNA ligase [bacterium]|nr:cysteine--tRNA ligase [bacterium]
MTIRLYNTMTRQKEDFVPQKPPFVSFYSCGPTVYGEFHVGNARTFVNVDVVRRWLIHRGYNVRYVQNITDIDDKIIARAHREGTTSESIAEKYTRYFLERLQILGNLPADEHPLATKHIGGMIAMIRKLEHKGNAYATPDGSVWFNVASFPEYGKLSQRPLDQMRQGERVDDELAAAKKSPLDFCLWKAAKPGEPSWTSPWGEGRPGWHIECSCMAIKTLRSDTIDIHSGGSDLIFPHHENEVAQSEAATGNPFVRFWMHFGMLDIDGEKMAKSEGNMKYLDDVLKVIDPIVLRYFFMSARYRDKLDYTDDNLHKCRSAVERMVTASRELDHFMSHETLDRRWQMDDELDELWEEFCDGMDDDFNTPRALGALAQTVTQVNSRRVAVANGERDAIDVSRAGALLSEMRGILGLGRELERADRSLSDAATSRLRAFLAEIGLPDAGSDPEAIMAALIERRATSRKSRDFATADRIRSVLVEVGIMLEDKANSTTWKKA